MEDNKVSAVEEIEEFVFEQLEDRIVPTVACVTSSSCNCSSSSCIVTNEPPH